MSLSQCHSFGGDFSIHSFHGNTTMNSSPAFSPFLDEEFTPSDIQSRHNSRESAARVAAIERPLSAVSRNDCDSTCTRLGQKSKRNRLISALKEKIIGDNASAENSIRTTHLEDNQQSSASSHTISQFDDDEEHEENTFRNEMYSNDCVIDSLKENYVCLNFEFNELQECHGKYVESQKDLSPNVEDENNCSDSSDHELQRKFTQVFHSAEIPEDPKPKLRNPTKKHKTQKKERMYVEDKENNPVSQHNNKEIKMILKTLRQMFKSPPLAARDTSELKKLYEVVKTLQEEQEKFRTIIKEQQDQLNDFHSRYIQAQDLIQSQKYEIKQLHHANTQLENELNKNMRELREKFQDKISEISHFPRAVRAEKTKCDKLARENCTLITRLQQVKQELVNARSKLEEACQKRTKILNKLKSAERDLKIFRTQNNTLKIEKRTLYEDMRKLKGANDDLKSTSSKSISRQKERGETQQRLLRKKIIDLEMELNRSRNSTKDLVEERDKLIAELHMQLNTLVHNFETSQKHIRILRRHIYSLSNSQIASEKDPQKSTV